MHPFPPPLSSHLHGHLHDVITWGAALAAPLVGVITVAITVVPLLWLTSRKFRRSNDAHWTERARLTVVPRTIAVLGIYVLPFIGFMMTLVLPKLWIAPFSKSLIAVVVAIVSSTTGIVLTHVLFTRHLPRKPKLRDTIAALMSLLAMLLPHVFVIGALTWLVPSVLGWETLLWAAVGLVSFVGIVLGAPVRALTLIGVLKPVQSPLKERLEAMASEVGLSPKRILQGQLGHANAFAFPITGDVIITKLAALVLEPDELAAVVAHELGHLSAPRLVIFSRVVPIGVLYLFPFTKLLPHPFEYAAWIAVGLLFLVARRVAVRLSRQDEVSADRVAAKHQQNPGVYARALEKLYANNLVPAVSGKKRAIHPDLYDRMIEAGVEPDYPRPARPPRWTPRLLAVVSLLLTASIWGAAFTPPKPWLSAVGVSKADIARLNVALGVADDYDFASLGQEAFVTSRWDRASTMYGAAWWIAPQYYAYSANRAVAEEMLCHCEDAMDIATIAYQCADARDAKVIPPAELTRIVNSCAATCRVPAVPDAAPGHRQPPAH